MLGGHPAESATHSSSGRLIRGHLRAGKKTPLSFCAQHLPLENKIRGEQVWKAIVCISSPAPDASGVAFHTAVCTESRSTLLCLVTLPPTPNTRVQWHLVKLALHAVKEWRWNEHQHLTQLFSVLSYFILHIHSASISPVIIYRRDGKERTPPCNYLESRAYQQKGWYQLTEVATHVSPGLSPVTRFQHQGPLLRD